MSWPQQNWQNAPTASSTTNTNQFAAGYSGGTTESQYAQYQNWQQWQTYHQQYAQWHAQYGELYQKEMQSQYSTTGAQIPPLPVPTTGLGVSLTAPLPPISLPVGFGGVPPPPPPKDKEPIPPPPDSAPPPPAEATDGEKSSIPFIGPIFPTDVNNEAKKCNQAGNADNNEDNSNLNNSGNYNFGFNNTNFTSMPPNFNQNNLNDQNQRFDWERSGNNNFNNNQRYNNRFDSNRESGRDSFGRDDAQNSRDNWNNQNQRDNWNNQNQRGNWSNQNQRGNNQNQRDNWNNQNQRDNRNNQRGDNQRENQNNSRDNWGGQNKRDSWNTSNQRGGDNSNSRDFENNDNSEEGNSNQGDNQNYRGSDNWKNQNQRGDNWNNQNQRGGGDNWNNRNQRGDRDFNRNNQNQRGNDNFRDNWNQNSRNNRNNRFSDSGFEGNQSQGGRDFSNEDSFTQNSRDKPNRYSDIGFGGMAMLPGDNKSNRHSDIGFGGGNQGSMIPEIDKPNRYSDSKLDSNQGTMPPLLDKQNRFSDSGFGDLQNPSQPNQPGPFIEKSSRMSDYESKSMNDSQTSFKDDPQKAIHHKSDPATGLELTPEEKAFDEQFQTWENEFVKWKQENANHPDRKAYREYEMKFEEFRRKLLDRRESMRKRRLDELNIGRRSMDAPFENLEQNLISQTLLPADTGLGKPIAPVTPTQPQAQEPVQQKHVQLAAQKPVSQIDQEPQQPPPQQQVSPVSQPAALAGTQPVQQVTQQPAAQPPAQQPSKSTPSKIPSLFDIKIDENLVEKSKWTSGSGIPGLDLIPASTASRDLEKPDEEEAEIINLDDENSPKKVDREGEKLKPVPQVKKLDLPLAAELKQNEPNSLSQGINNILGDPNLVSILNLVQPALSQINPQAINQLNPLLSVLGALTKQQQSSPQQNTLYQPLHHQQPPNLFNQTAPHPDSLNKSRGLSREASASRMSCDRSIASEDEKNIDKSGNTSGDIVFESDDFAARLRELKAGKFNLNDTRANSEVKDVVDHKTIVDKKTQEEDDNSFEKRLRDLKAGRLGNLLGDREPSSERKLNVSSEETPRNPPNENTPRFARRSRFTNISDEPQRLLPLPFETNSVQGSFDEKRNEQLKSDNRSSVGQDFNKPEFDATKNSEEMFKPTQVIDYQNKPIGLAAGQNRWDGVDILMPAKVVDYGHRKPANTISNTESFGNNFMKPMKTIDYGHTSTAIGQRRQANDDYLNQYNKRSRLQDNSYQDNNWKNRENQDNNWKNRDNPDNNWKNRDNQDNNWRNRDNRQDNRDFQDNRNSGNFMDNSGGYPNKWVPKNFQQQQQSPVSLIDNSFDEQIKRAKFLKTQRSSRDYRDDSCTQLSDNSNSGKLPEDLEAVSDEENPTNVDNENMLDDADDISADEFDDNNYDDELMEEDEVDEKLQQPLPQRQPVVKPTVTAKPISPPKKIVLGANTISMDDILLSPGRKVRPPRILIIMRGPPGCGKTFLSKLIKDKEVEMGGSAPRIMSIDDYFMSEVDSVEKCPKTGRDIKIKKMEYEYEPSMEETYYNYLMKSFKKNITDGLFNFIIVDCTNETEKSYSDFYNFGKSNGFTPYVCQLEIDLQTCLNRNTHKRLEEDIEKMVKNWVPTPEHYLKVDSRSLLQSIQISEVEMEDVISDEEFLADDGIKNNVEVDEDEGGNEFGMFKSKWETGPSTEENLARLDGTSKPLRQATIKDFLQTDDDVAWEPTASKPGKKRVRWADIEEKRAQEKMRAIGFVVGQTDWGRMMDPTGGSGALTQTKYIERLKKK